MNILVVVAVLAVFGVLRLRRTNLLVWAIAWWVGIYVLIRFGFSTPIPSSVVTLYMGIVTIAILAYMSSSEERREEVSRPLLSLMTDKRYTALLAATVVALPALAAANVYFQMNVPLQPPFFPGRSIRHRRPRSRFTTRRSISMRETTRSGNSKRRIRKSSANMSRTGAASTTGTASSATGTIWAATGCSCTGWTRSRPISRTEIPSRTFARRSCSGESRREVPGCPMKVVPGIRPCLRGRSS